MNNTITRANCDSELLLSWLQSKPSKITQKRYTTNIKQFFSFIGNRTLSELKVEDIQDFMRMLEMKGYKSATISQKLNTVKSLFTYAVKVGYLEISPCVVVKSPIVHCGISQKLLTTEDVKLMVNHAKFDRDKLIIKTLFSLGLRISELVRMTWNDFYILPTGEVKVIIIGKGNKKRELVMATKLYQELLTIKETDNPYLFHAWWRVSPLKDNAVYYILKKIAKKCGLSDKLSAHWLRHSHATEAIKNGCDLSLLMQSMGHSSITTTQKYLCYRNTEGSSNFIDI
jgi:integrase/recombinase XerD